MKSVGKFSGRPVGTGPEGFIVNNAGLLQVIPLTGGTPKTLADFGSGTNVKHAQIAGNQVYVVAESYTMYSSYLFEIDIP